MNASARPMTVCRPRNGEKPRNTPSAKAAAVRCGVSWVCSSCSSHDRMRLKPTIVVNGNGLLEMDESGGERFYAAVSLDARRWFDGQLADFGYFDAAGLLDDVP